MSLDLRGVLPTIEELDAVEADPTQLTAYRDAYLQDARLEDRLVAMFNEIWYTRVDDFDIEYFDYHLDGMQEYTFEKSVGEEPLRLLAYVAVNDLPWSEVVLADYTRANEMLASIWPVDYPDGGTGWQVAHYTDGRPPVGVLASTGLWWRYPTNSFNMNRGRANAISRLLVCEDMLARPVTFSSTPSLLDADATASAIQNEPYCVACHAMIEPIATNLFGFYPNEAFSVYEQTYYHPERELMGPLLLNVEPAWYGTPVSSLRTMAEAIAVDPRFPKCAAETMATVLWRRQPQITDFNQIDAFRQTFEDNGMVMRALITKILESPEYQAGGLTDDASEETTDREMTSRMMSPNQLGTAIQDLTGFYWYVDGYEQMENDRFGYRILAGGVNGTNVLQPQSDPGLTWALVVKRLAQAGAAWAADEQLVDGAEGSGLFADVDLAAVPGDESFETVLAELHWRFYAVRPDEARLQAARDLWSSVYASSGAALAWQSLVGAMLRDPEFVSY